MSLLGSWRLRSSRWTDEHGEVESPLGRDCEGLLIYAHPDIVSVQLMRPHQRRFEQDDWRLSTTHERAAAWIGYYCYYGRFAVDENRRIVRHYVEGSWFPNLIGTEQVRSYILHGNLLTLTADAA